MCLGIPAQVMEIAESVAIVDVGGVRREVSVELIDDVATGDWVIIHAGFAIQKLDPEEAEKTLRLFKEIADAIP
ncbi:MAG: HypC/HybG/HupF family hydrogenase formation chaperone [Deltaproteobacteria bacterium]|nr:HypC/HybG/HupF family hydrogenase formation chaperone [Deltaproteobacteria bacterium]